MLIKECKCKGKLKTTATLRRADGIVRYKKCKECGKKVVTLTPYFTDNESVIYEPVSIKRHFKGEKK